MNAQETLQAILNDLWKIREASQREGFEDIPKVAWDYLSANYDIIHSYLVQVYTKMNDAQRSELLQHDRRLDSSAVSSSWYSIAMTALEKAKSRTEYGFEIGQISDDNINCLMRALEFARHCPLDESDHKLSLSPIAQHGLDAG